MYLKMKEFIKMGLNDLKFDKSKPTTARMNANSDPVKLYEPFLYLKSTERDQSIAGSLFYIVMKPLQT